MNYFTCVTYGLNEPIYERILKKKILIQFSYRSALNFYCLKQINSNKLNKKNPLKNESEKVGVYRNETADNSFLM